MFALVKRPHADGLSILLVEQNVAQSLEVAHRLRSASVTTIQARDVSTIMPGHPPTP
jgi:ABC-type branched-subunit amino acid transport system ATPase component